MAHLLKLFHTRAAQFRGFSREFVTLRVAPFVLLSAHENLNSRQEQTTDIVLTYKILKMQKRSKTIFSDIFVMVVLPPEKGVILGVLGLSFLFLPPVSCGQNLYVQNIK